MVLLQLLIEQAVERLVLELRKMLVLGKLSLSVKRMLVRAVTVLASQTPRMPFQLNVCRRPDEVVSAVQPDFSMCYLLLNGICWQALVHAVHKGTGDC